MSVFGGMSRGDFMEEREIKGQGGGGVKHCLFFGDVLNRCSLGGGTK